MTRIALAVLLSGVLGTATAAGGKAGAKGKNGPPLGAAPASVPTGSGRGGGTLVLGAGVVAGRALYPDRRNLPPLDPGREVTEQDCTKPIDLTRGNLKCK